ncbi:unnamed protein product, partial [Brassica rapa subsp. trilocularis]
MREEAWIREIKSRAMLFLATINLPRILFISPSPSFSFALFKKNKRGSRLVQGLLWLTVKFTQGKLYLYVHNMVLTSIIFSFHLCNSEVHHMGWCFFSLG